MTLPAVKEDVPANIRAMLGPPALLPGEDATIYEATLAHFAREVAPRDLPSWIGGYQQLDRCLQAAEQRFVATLRDVERHAAGFGKTLRHVDLIEGAVLCEEAV